MINPLNFPVLVLPGSLPATSLLTREELEKRKALKANAEAAFSSIEEEAAAIRADAEALLQQTREEVQLILDNAREEANNLKCRAREEAVVEAVQWLCDEQMLERRIAQELQHRWRHLTAQCLKELLEEYDQNGMLLYRLEARIQDMLLDGRISLSLPPSALHQASILWKDCKEIELKTDVALQEGQACIDNGLIRIHLDLPAQQSLLFTQLVNM